MSRGDLTKMNKQNKSNWKKVAAVAGAALLVGLTAGAVAHPFSTSQAVLNETVSLAQSEAFNDGVASVDLIVCAAPVEVIKEVPIYLDREVEVIEEVSIGLQILIVFGIVLFLFLIVSLIKGTIFLIKRRKNGRQKEINN